MAESTVIKEFLVRLGFKTDEDALKKFDRGITTATKSVFALGVAVEGVALAVSISVAKFAQNLEQLYFASMRTGASATNIKAFSRAAQDFGASAEDAQGAIEGLARFLRNNPGGEGLLASMGVRTRDPKTGQMRDTADMLTEMGQKFAAMPTFLASQYANQFGMSDNMMLALRSGGFAGDKDSIAATFKKANLEKAAKDSHDFQMAMRRLADEFFVLQTRVYDAFEVYILPYLEKFRAWLRINGPWLEAEIVKWVKQLFVWAAKIPAVLEVVIQKLKELDKQTGGWSTKILEVVVALRLLGGGGIIGGVLSMAAAVLSLGVALAPIIAGAGGLAVAAAAIAYMATKATGLDSTIGGGIYDFFHKKENAHLSLTNMGWSAAQADGIVANLQSESGIGANKTGDDGLAYGIAQWHPDRQADFAKWAGHDIHGSSTEEQLAFVNYELRQGKWQGAGKLLRAATNAQQAGEIVSRSYERPADADGEAARRGALAAQISQQTTITVNGSTDPASTASAVLAGQDRVNSALTRNVQNAVQ